VRNFRHVMVLSGLATAGALASLAVVGSSVATAATRLRSGAVRDQLVSHVTPAAGAAAQSGAVPTGATAMAAAVACMAVVALCFVVVTFIRRRVAV
jgi:hypothetical protein